MKTEDILKHFFPSEILEYFEIVDAKDNSGKLVFYLDEKHNLPEEFPKGDYESKGFTAPIQLVDYPIRDREVLLEVRRRKWLDKKTGKVISRTWNLTAEGTRYTKEFGVFLKELARH